MFYNKNSSIIPSRSILRWGSLLQGRVGVSRISSIWIVVVMLFVVVGIIEGRLELSATYA